MTNLSREMSFFSSSLLHYPSSDGMPLNQTSHDSHWRRVTRSFCFDAAILPIAFKIGAAVRFVDLVNPKELGYIPAILAGAMVLPSLLYIFGFYGPNHLRRQWGRELVFILIILALTTLVVLAMGSIVYSARVGRGVIGISMAVTAVLVFIRHLGVRNDSVCPRTAFVVGSLRDEQLAVTFSKTLRSAQSLVGVFTTPGYKAISGLTRLGCARDIDAIVESLGIERVMCNERLVDVPSLSAKLRKLRFQGVNVTTLCQAFEEQYQIIPLELVTDHWLLDASSQPRMFYIRKLKRTFDLIVGSTMLILLAPFCAVVALLVKLTSPGPVIYRQTRSGKFGRPFQVLKFRSMRVDAEADGKARWWSSNDPRETILGKWLRKFRIDEIPQLINILRGDMTFVGPRPERPEFVTELASKVPFYMERLMVLPGLTGWAQVNYPYGSTVEDAARKTEFDLYYMKHMSLILDVFILLDTFRTVVNGGATHRETGREALHGLHPAEASPASQLADSA